MKGTIRAEGGWRIFDKRYDPGPSVAGHLTFALTNEPLDLLVLKRIFEVLPEPVITACIQATPQGKASRRTWYLYESLTGKELEIAEAPPVKAVPVLDPDVYYTIPGRLSRRHRVRDNLLGTGRFCPLVRRTEALERLVHLDLATQVRKTLGEVSTALIARAASFLLLADSRASFEIEGERPPRTRLERWARVIRESGRNPLTIPEFERLHRTLIEDNRFVHPGLRPDGVFIGDRGPGNEPLPEFIGARPDDLVSLLSDLIAVDRRMREGAVDPVIQAAATAFGFVHVHPYQDGNGRVHRYLIHHVLAERGFSPPGVVFPVSSVMLERVEDYRATLRAHGSPLMDHISWIPTERGNVEVLNDTADLYRYFDATRAAEFLYGCVEQTVQQDLPGEIEYLRRRDAALGRMMDHVDMPDRLAGDLLVLVRQNGGRLPNRRRRAEFEQLSDQEVAALENIIKEEFQGFDEEFERYASRRAI